VGYDAFYISSAQALSKPGAEIRLEMNVRTVAVEQMTPEERYEFRRRYIIDKNEYRVDIPEIYISEVIWEYWNGIGWAHLKVEGDKNPFSCQSAGQKMLSFACPEDIQPVVVGALRSHYIRARVAFVENAFDPMGRKLLPFIQEAALHFEYRSWRSPERITVQNNLRETVVEEADRTDWGPLTLYEGMEDENPSVYMGFDRPMSGYPLTMYLDVEGLPEKGRNLEFEAFMAGGFQRVKVMDETDSLSGSGILELFIQNPLERVTLFSHEACWLRITDLSRRYGNGQLRPPRVRSIVLNAAQVRQCRTLGEERFAMEAFEVHKQLRLAQTPVLECAVWVDALGSLAPGEREALLLEPGAARVEEENGEESAFFVRCRQVEDLSLCGADEYAYTLDGATGLVTFGDGVHGRIPPPGDESIRVRCRAGGGSAGNLPAGAIAGLMGTLAFVDTVTNFLPTCGGNDSQPIELVEALGPLRIRHRYRAQTPADFEAIVRERFNEVRDVRCHANTAPDGAHQGGCVTVVITGNDDGEQSYGRKLSGEILEYLRQCCDCTLLASDRLRVIPAHVMDVSITATVELSRYDDAVLSERALLDALEALIERPLRQNGCRRIGYMPAMADIYAALGAVENVAAVRKVALEGAYYENNTLRMVTLDGKSAYPMSIIRNGTHRILL
jgi:hypothetical protein